MQNDFITLIFKTNVIIFTATTIGSCDPQSNNTWIIFGVVMTAAVVIVTAILIVTCFRYRKILKRENTRDVGKFQNTVYKGDIQPDTPPQVRPTDYEQPSQYAQLDSSKRVLVDENYQSLNAEGYDQLQTNSNESVSQYISLDTNSNHAKRIRDESTYEELPL